MRYLTFPAIVFVTGLLLAAPPKVNEVISGKVVGVIDGDTITVLVNNATIKVRREGNDSPESGQSYGTKSKQALSEIVFGNAVTIKTTETDKYCRKLGIVIVGDVDAKRQDDRGRLGLALQEVQRRRKFSQARSRRLHCEAGVRH